MAYTRVKICGITRPDDALAVANSGADALGLVFYEPSPRSVTLASAVAIANAAPPLLSLVALFVDAPETVIRQVLAEVPIDLLQFHGEETPQFCEQFGRPYLKALRMREGVDLGAACMHYRSARGLLLDSWQPGTPGGTGQRFDWDLATAVLTRPMILAGGLDAGNVGEAIAKLSPAAVDISGGVETEPGLKDGVMIQRFVAAVRRADQQAIVSERSAANIQQQPTTSNP